MADNVTTLRRRVTKARDHIEHDLRDEIADLRAEIASVSRAVSDLGYSRLGDIRHGAVDSLDDALHVVSRQGKQVATLAAREARMLRTAVQDNPVPAVAVLAAVAVLSAFLVQRQMR